MDKKQNQDQKKPKKKIGIDPAIPEKALKIIRTIGQGNGLKPDQVSFVDFIGKTVTAQAQTIITLKPLVSKKNVPGRDSQGKVVESEQGLHNAINQSSELLSQDDTVSQKVKDTVLERKDQGFAMKDYKQKFSAFTKHFALHTACKSCHSNGKTTCQNCRGMRKMPCKNCRGSKFIRCLNCNGTCMTQTPKGQQIQCTKCQGQGREHCTICRGHGQIQCRTCAATGKIQCQNCAATGWTTNSAMVEQEGVFSFHITRDEMDEDLADMIEKNGAQMLLKHDLEANVRELTETEKSDLEPEQIPIGYDVRIPYGELTFQLKNKTLSSILLGYQGRLINPPAFIESLTKKHLTLLKRGAIAPSAQTASLLEKACKARIIKDILKISAEENQKNALKALLIKYPYGIREKTLTAMIKYARKSFLDLTQAGRYKGLALGMLVAGVITGLYYFVLRASLIPSLPQTVTAVTIADIIAFAVGFGGNLFLVRMVGKSDLSKSLQALLKKPVKVRATQIKTGSTWMWSLLGNIVLFLGVSWIAFTMGFVTTPPIWLRF